MKAAPRAALMGQTMAAMLAASKVVPRAALKAVMKVESWVACLAV